MKPSLELPFIRYNKPSNIYREKVEKNDYALLKEQVKSEISEFQHQIQQDAAVFSAETLTKSPTASFQQILNLLHKEFPSNKFSKLSNMWPPKICLLYTSPSPRDLSTSRMPSSA